MTNPQVKQEIWVKVEHSSDLEIEISSISKMFQFCLPSEVINYIDTLFHSMIEHSGNTQELVPEIADISMVIRHMKDAFKELKVRDKRGNIIH